MRLDHEFTVPAPIEDVWHALIDPERVAPCMPGATLTTVEGDAFAGTMKVKLGPISLLYKGKGEFLEKDEAGRKVTIKASGKDSRGAGTAAATVTVTLAEVSGGTRGAVSTELSITGKPAQFGRGLIVEVGGKILDTFAGCLAGKLAPAERETAASAPAAPPVPVAEGAAGAAGPASGGRAGAGQVAAAGVASAAGSEAGVAPVGGPGAAAGVVPGEGLGVADSPAVMADGAGELGSAAGGVGASGASGVAGDGDMAGPKGAGSGTGERPVLRSVPAAPETEAIDLLDYAGASLVKRAVPVLVGLVVVGGLVAVLRALRK